MFKKLKLTEKLQSNRTETTILLVIDCNDLIKQRAIAYIEVERTRNSFAFKL